jgi:hypothetical protein
MLRSIFNAKNADRFCTEQISLIVDIFDLGQSYMGTLIL